MADAGPWSSPSDLAEYAFCPRARYYRGRLGDPPPTALRRSGARFHTRTLRATRRRARWGAVYWGALGIGATFVALGLLELLR